ncbi:gluconokinase [Lonepinella sp. BR2271]|uniref:gluconokinase n=1 Tax=Lonepinella sp. BR2271 TaxID=3434550 RepID=UPI003F6DE051
MNESVSQGSSFILMGVSSTGKTSVGTAVANKLGLKLIDGDDLHPRANIIKMRQGHPLNDEDRLPWLERIRDAAFSLEQKSEKGIIVCSALKKKYRDLIRDGNGNVKFLFLHGSFALILERMKQRKGHFMKEEMLKSQFDTLEIPQADEPDVIAVDIEGSFDEVVERCVRALEPLLDLQHKE